MWRAEIDQTVIMLKKKAVALVVQRLEVQHHAILGITSTGLAILILARL
jgi:hypothetical protein